MINKSAGLVHFVDEDNNRSWSFDLRGFFRAAVAGKVKYKRAWSGALQKIKLEPRGGFSRKNASFVPSEEAENMLAGFHAKVKEFCLKKNCRDAWEKHVGEFSSRKYKQNSRRFKKIWGSVPILPPDQYRAFVLNLSSSCSYNRCNFCDFYDGIEFDWKSPGQFSSHINQAADFFAGVEDFFTEIFIGAGDALAVPPESFEQALSEIQKVSSLRGMPVHVFAPGNLARRRTQADMESFVEGGLKRVYFGLESGSKNVLDKLNKPFKPEDITAGVKLCHAAGAAVGIIILIGAGGKKYSETHVEATLDLLNALNFGPEDRIFLSPLGEGKIGWTGGAKQQSLSSKEKHKREKQIRAGLKKSLPVAHYEVENFIY
jgi:hypothetical protein